MIEKFQYTVLRYRPSLLLQESVNIGLLFYFPAEDKFIFRSPSSLLRLRNLYPDLESVNQIKFYLNSFSKAVTKLSLNSSERKLSTEVLNSLFLVLDSNSLYFSDIKEGNISKDYQYIIDYFEKQFFKSYTNNKYQSYTNKFKNDFNQKLRIEAKRKHLTLENFHSKVSLQNKIHTTEFDYGWQNGKTNLIKIIGFNLSNQDSIQKKAFRWFGELKCIESFINANNLKIDFLVTTPKSKNLEKSYIEAIEVLSSLSIPKQVVEENKIDTYIDNALETMKPLIKDNLKL